MVFDLREGTKWSTQYPRNNFHGGYLVSAQPDDSIIVAVKSGRKLTAGYREEIAKGLTGMGIIASMIGAGILAYNQYYCTVSEGLFLLACGLVITGVLFYFFLERQ